MRAKEVICELCRNRRLTADLAMLLAQYSLREFQIIGGRPFLRISDLAAIIVYEESATMTEYSIQRLAIGMSRSLAVSALGFLVIVAALQDATNLIGREGVSCSGYGLQAISHYFEGVPSEAIPLAQNGVVIYILEATGSGTRFV